MDKHSNLQVPMEQEYCFGPFRFHSARHLLFSEDAVITTNRRALDVLAVLLERPGELVSKRELIERVWQDSTVQENNLTVQIAKLRKALGDDTGRRWQYIATVNGRGYRFVAPIDRRHAGPRATAAGAVPAGAFALPAAPRRTIGRAAAIDAVRALLARRRLVSVVGPGGIGKTVLALALAHHLVESEGIAACFLDLSVGADTCAALDALARVLEAQHRPERTILVLDSCERMSEAAVTRLDQVLARLPGMLVLASGRAPLSIAGEAVHRIAPLAYPAAGGVMTAAQALDFPAIELFARRAARCLDGYRLCDADVPAVTAICARLEGHPLAIGMAARHMETMSANDIAARLDDSLGLLRTGDPAAQPRHASLAASFDWSYAALSESERRILGALAVLPEPFTLDAAKAMLGGARLDADTIVDGISALVTKSILLAAMHGADMHYRLPATIKPFAVDKHVQAGGRRALPGRRADGLAPASGAAA